MTKIDKKSGNKKFPDLNIQILSVDVGAKTQDILLYNGSYEKCFKLILPSASYRLFHTAKKYTKQGKHIIITGEVMGGGPFKIALYDHIKKGLRVCMTPRAAQSIKDNPDEVRKTGIEILSEDEAGEKLKNAAYAHIVSADIDSITLMSFLEKNGFSVQPDIIAVAVQDHGYAGPHENDNITRFRLLKESIPGTVNNFGFSDPPGIYSRMCGIKRLLKKYFPDSQHVIMDSKIAGIFGALYGSKIQSGFIIEAGNAHITAALIKEEVISAIFEHHTRMVLSSPGKLAYFFNVFKTGKLTNNDIINDGGHGCYIPRDIMDETTSELPIFITGPNRDQINEPGFTVDYALPHNDVMIAGNIGLVECCKRILRIQKNT